MPFNQHVFISPRKIFPQRPMHGQRIAHTDPQTEAAELQTRITNLEAVRDRMRRVNSLVRNRNTRALKEMGYSQAQIEKMLTPNCDASGGFFPTYKLRNNDTKLRALKSRLKELDALLGRIDLQIEREGYVYTEDGADGRVSFRFLAKPDKVIRAALRKYGFIHSAAPNIYDRPICSAAIVAANRLRAILDGEQ